MSTLGFNPFGNDIRHEFAYMTGHELRGVSIQYRESDMLFIFKAWDPAGMPKCLFVACTYEEQAWEYLTENYASERPFLKFVSDKFAKFDKSGNSL